MLEGPSPATHPWAVALRAVFGLISGALPLTLAVVFISDDWRLTVSLLVVIVSLTCTGLVSARAGVGHPARAVFRSLMIGLIIALLSYVAGNVFEVIDQFLPQIDVDSDVTPSPSP